MAVSSVNVNTPADQAKSILGSAAAPVPSATQNPDQQVSAVVSISKQGQALSQSGKANQQPVNANNTQQANPALENKEGTGAEKTEKPGIQFLEGEKNSPLNNKGTRVNTFA
jgi:hypothetical protein